MSHRPEIRRGVVLALAASALLAASACGNSTPAAPAAAAAATQAPATHDMGTMNGMPMSGDMGGMQMGSGTELWAVQTSPLGVIVTDGTGRMLYRSDADRANPPAANCTGTCATTWVPLRVTDGQPPDLEGVDQAKVGTVARADGAAQITLAGWPLYWHQGEAPGLATAGSNGKDGWFVASPTGAKASG
jgi:predicted lipoprotein with Yx(FWY)xxD motif